MITCPLHLSVDLLGRAFRSNIKSQGDRFFHALKWDFFPGAITLSGGVLFDSIEELGKEYHVFLRYR